MSGKTATVSQSTPAAGNLRIQTAVYGTAIQIVYGTARISGNLAWFGGFQAIPNTSTTSSGGKGGGGVKTESTTYTYAAAVLMVLCEGPVNAILSAWKGKTRYSGQPVTQAPAQAVDQVTLPVFGPGTFAYQVGIGGAAFLNDVSVTNSMPESYDNSGGE